MSSPLLSIQDLTVVFKQPSQQEIPLVNGVNIDIFNKECVALVGESGSGKSVTAQSILRLLPKTFTYPSGEILFADQSLLNASDRSLRKIRGNKISMIFQEPMVSLNPLHTIEKQLMEVLALHCSMPRLQARSEILLYLDRVGVKETRLSAYPHQLSGGERQRVMIAMAILTKPQLLIADEPTTALDVSVQAQIIKLLKELKHELDMSILFISHNLSVVKKIADNVTVMRKGEVVEQNSRHRIFLLPQHPYTKMLLNSEPTGDPTPLPNEPGILLSVNQLNVDLIAKKRFFRSQKRRILENIGFTVHQGEAVGLVGESGSGKSSAALAILRLVESQGHILFDSHPIEHLSPKKLLPFRSRMQIVFQDPFSSLNPRFTVEQIISEGIMTHKKCRKSERDQMVINIMKEVGLDPATRFRYPMEFSGGERQRIAIARALILQPELLILDEPTSSLDHTIQLQIIQLFKLLQERYQLSYLFISHDLSVIHSLCHKVVVMREGKIVEQGSREKIFTHPESEYTKSLLSFLDRNSYNRMRMMNRDNVNKKEKKSSDVVKWDDALLIRKKQ